VKPDPEARAGTISNVPFPSEALGGVRSVNLYLPARFRKRRRYPLLVAHDGDDYVRFSNLKQVLDNLIHRQEIPPMIVALTNPQRRLQEYAADRAHSTFIVKELLPWLEKEFPLLEGAPARGLMGASFGAVASLAIGLHYPGVFGNLLLQSGSFAFSDFGPHARTKEFDPVVKFINAFRERPKKPAERAFVTCGIFESLVYENRSMVPVFQQTGMSVRYVEARDGHNWENWRDRLREGLSWLFPGPLWLVYE
jgi:enterochelin esterase family protein